MFPLSDAPVFNVTASALVSVEGAYSMDLLLPSFALIIEKTSFKDGKDSFLRILDSNLIMFSANTN